MKPYPSIPGWAGSSVGPVYLFDKIDGSNVKIEISRKGEISKFGKRHGLLDDQTPYLNEAREIIPDKFGKELALLIKQERWESATCFFEFHGENSFAGTHYNEAHTCTLLDIAPHKKGMIEAKDFIKLCSGMDHAKLLYYGNFNADTAKQVSEGTLEGMTFEGVIAKGSYDKKLGMPLMFKWKSNAWREKLKNFCKDDHKLFESLV